MYEIKLRCHFCGRIFSEFFPSRNEINIILKNKKSYVCSRCEAQGLKIPKAWERAKIPHTQEVHSIREELENKLFNPSQSKNLEKTSVQEIYDLARLSFMERFNRAPSEPELEEAVKKMLNLFGISVRNERNKR